MLEKHPTYTFKKYSKTYKTVINPGQQFKRKKQDSWKSSQLWLSVECVLNTSKPRYKVTDYDFVYCEG